MAADRTSRSWGIRVEGGTALRGRTLRQDGQSVGRVTSSTWSPYQVCGIGIAHLDGTKLQPGDIVEVDCDDGEKRQGQLCSLPMYDPKGEIVRGINTTAPATPEPWPGIKIPETA
ncbi:glycine cleavage T C-terminal barrel domain-containing protein [Pseudophaeobacter sp. EL27]|uniref:glycine cleavage T C-terminal barrel domain-containing protein n=1 Tax=Pseudophaeobacter sp. EL27 TaxID=2107580 RepID=UPI000EFABC21|nr:glycine cleavage T C-terminal barrel domain-containing protein [Pseudophaeobacter sp. EL27]